MDRSATQPGDGTELIGEGAHIAVSFLAWPEKLGRLVTGFYFGSLGLLFAGGSALRLIRQDNPQSLSSMVPMGFGLIYLFLAGLAVRGRFTLVAVYLGLGWIATVLIPLLAPSENLAGAGPDWTGLLLGHLLPLSSLGWIAARRSDAAKKSGAMLSPASAILGAVFVACLWPLGSYLGAGLGMLAMPSVRKEVVSAGQRVPGIRFHDLDGKWKSLSEPGVVYIVNFWATWCGPCRLEMPGLLAYYRSLPAGSPVRLLAVNTERLGRAAVEEFLARENLVGLPVYTDPDEVKRTMGFDSIPVTLLIRDGRIIERHSGYGAGLIDRIAAEVSAEIATDETPKALRAAGPPSL